MIRGGLVEKKYSEIRIKDLVSYDDKLNKYEDYVKMLNILEKNVIL